MLFVDIMSLRSNYKKCCKGNIPLPPQVFMADSIFAVQVIASLQRMAWLG